MKYKYKGPNNIRKKINDIAEGGLILYAVLGSMGNAPMTGHLSSDIYLKLKQPTALEKILIEQVGDNSRILGDYMPGIK